MSEGSGPIVLVHGAWGSSASWGAVTPMLSATGREVLAIDLPGHGSDRTPPVQVSLNVYAARISEVLAQTGPALLVGHSMGGMAISAAAEQSPDLVRKLVYVTAFLPRDGQSLVDLMKQQGDTAIRDAVRPADVPGATVLDPDLAGKVLFSDVPEALRAKVIDGLCRQPNRPQTDRIHLTEARFGRIPRAYVFCERDRTISPALQRKMVEESPCDETFSLDCGHFPQLVLPHELTEILKTL